ncbi:MAG: 16S rRNA (uracil(1498)-N(3))-methyltransferase [Bacteroidia bacterium]|nr:16S rRNA (uracil(1498)-N(3))-methyltransferase [Bacteroidia bacterium]
MYLFLIQGIEGNYGYMDADEAAHCIKVLRKNTGDTVFCIDGKGGFYEGQIEKIAKTGVTVLLKHKTENYGEKQSGKLILAASPLRQKERFEWLIEKATELGVDEIYPVISRYTITENIKQERLQNIIVSAAKQCKRARFPVLHKSVAFESFFSAPVHSSVNLIAWCEAKVHINDFQTEIKNRGNTVMMIGPEGDFSAQEIALAQKNNYLPVSLGESRLRTETAGIFALSLIKGFMGY